MRDTQYKVIQVGCMSIQGGIRWSAVNIRVYSEWSVYKGVGMDIRMYSGWSVYKDVGMDIRKAVRDIRMYSEWSVYKDVGMSIRKAVRDIRKGKEGGRRRVGGLRNPDSDFSQTDTEISQASIAIVKACGSDKSSVKFESLICLPPYYLNRK